MVINETALRAGLCRCRLAHPLCDDELLEEFISDAFAGDGVAQGQASVRCGRSSRAAMITANDSAFSTCNRR